jgi:SLT domain-containing protein
MSEENKYVRTREELEERILSRAFARGGEAERDRLAAEIEERKERTKMTPEERDALMAFRMMNEGQPRSVRMLNLLAQREGSSKRFKDNDGRPEGPTVH